MVPKGLNIDNTLKMKDKKSTSKTYKLDFNNYKIQGFVDGIEAIKQAIYKILNTQRYNYLIYSFNYGVELESLIGQDLLYIKADIKRIIKEALTQDDRITDVVNFEITEGEDKESIFIKFDVLTTLGLIPINQEVRV